MDDNVKYIVQYIILKSDKKPSKKQISDLEKCLKKIKGLDRLNKSDISVIIDSVFTPYTDDEYMLLFLNTDANYIFELCEKDPFFKQKVCKNRNLWTQKLLLDFHMNPKEIAKLGSVDDMIEKYKELDIFTHRIPRQEYEKNFKGTFENWTFIGCFACHKGIEGSVCMMGDVDDKIGLCTVVKIFDPINKLIVTNRDSIYKLGAPADDQYVGEDRLGDTQVQIKNIVIIG